MRRTTYVTAALALSALLTACGSDDTMSSGTPEQSVSASSAAAKPGAEVPMVFTEFKPTDFAIKAGETLTFVNENPIAHTIVGGSWTAGPDGLRTSEKADGSYSLDVAKKGDRVEHTFTMPGTYQFFCTIHFGMNGTVVVS